jgi:predicted transcriptional regulator
MFRHKPSLSNLEQIVMRVLWDHGSATSEDIRQTLEKTHYMKESTCRTILRRLEEKGYVKHRVEGRTNIYTGVEQPENVAAKAVHHIIDRFCGGSVEQLLVGLVDSEMIGKDELKELAQKIARRRKPTKGD